ncbi:MAG: peptidylprolyl isomerase [Candidatus Omnitrophica bacterium]|nr:peptidylprolyl isomerase [Candidatus Omnitrophota bacterium]
MAGWMLMAACLPAVTALAEVMDRVLAVVNDDVITQRDLERVLVAALPSGELEQLHPGDAAWREALQQLVEERLIVQAAKRAGLAPNQEEIARRFDEMKQRFGSEQAYRAALAEEGLTETELQARYADQWLMQRVVEQEVRAKLRVTPTEIAQEYAQHRDAYQSQPAALVRMILIKPKEGETSDAAKRRAEQIGRQAQAGVDFSDLAKRYSQGPNADEGGSLGYLEAGELLPALDAAVQQLKPGQISNVIEANGGWHMLKVEERRAGTTADEAAVQAKIEQRLLKQKFERAFGDWVAKLKAAAYIVMK